MPHKPYMFPNHVIETLHVDSLAKGPFSAVGSRVLRLAGLRCRVLYPAEPNGKEAPYLSEGRQTSEARLHLEFGMNRSVRLKMP